MMPLRAQRWRGRDRIVPAISALLVNILLGYALIVGLRGPSLYRAVADSATLALFDLQPPPPERPKPPPPPKSPKATREGGSTPAPPPRARAMHSEPVPTTTPAPPPVVATPSPVTSPSMASDTADGDTDGTGGGSGSGGTGTGTGSGDGDGGSFARARQTGGRFRNSDFPNSLRGVGRLKIGVRYAIGPSGHVDKCEVIEGSGYAEVDMMTCRIIMERYRFRPARDPDGYAVTEVREEDYRWLVRSGDPQLLQNQH